MDIKINLQGEGWYRLFSSDGQIILSKEKFGKNKKGEQIVTVSMRAYYATVQGALKRVLDDALIDSEVNTMQELLKKFQEFTHKILCEMGVSI